MTPHTQPVIFQKNVATLHSARCGSTVIGNMLNNHSKVYWGGEIFLEYMKTDISAHPKNLLEVALRESESHCFKDIHGFEIKYLSNQHLSKQCLNMSLEDYVTTSQKLGVTHFIGMHRRNHLRRLISLKVGVKKGYWHSERQESPELVSIEINSTRGCASKNSLVDAFDGLDYSFEQLQKCVPSGSLFLTYEDDIQHDPRVGYRKICGFLGIEDEHPEIKLKRTNPFSYDKMVTNFDDVKSALKGTRHEWMLDD